MDNGKQDDQKHCRQQRSGQSAESAEVAMKAATGQMTVAD